MTNDAVLSKNWQDITVVGWSGRRKCGRKGFCRILKSGLARAAFGSYGNEYNSTKDSCCQETYSEYRHKPIVAERHFAG
jgi:hypothetical protein